jgi:hypothetical protein
MKKSDLKKLIKPLVKECIHEVLLEEGLLSSIVSEVAQGMQSNLVVETARAPAPPRAGAPAPHNTERKVKQRKLQEQRRKLMDSIGADSYNGVNLFEDTAPMSSQEATAASQGDADLGDPRNSGVDISSLVGAASKVWDAIK